MAGQDELRLGYGTGILIEPLELDVLELVQTESVVKGMKLGGFLRTAAPLHVRETAVFSFLYACLILAILLMFLPEAK